MRPGGGTVAIRETLQRGQFLRRGLGRLPLRLVVISRDIGLCAGVARSDLSGQLLVFGTGDGERRFGVSGIAVGCVRLSARRSQPRKSPPLAQASRSDN